MLSPQSKSTIKPYIEPPPLPADFGLTSDDIVCLERIKAIAYFGHFNGLFEKAIELIFFLLLVLCLLFFLFSMILPFISFFITELSPILLTWCSPLYAFPALFLPAVFFLPLILISTLIAHVRFKLHPKSRNFESYKNAQSQHEKIKQELLHQYEKAQKEFWFGLSGHAFEHHLADLYRQLGYTATVTRGSGDKGIDIILISGKERHIVQCKQHSKPVGPATIRELYGALMADQADSAILASTSGFTKGVFDFIRGKPLKLIDVESIIQMQEEIRAERSAEISVKLQNTLLKEKLLEKKTTNDTNTTTKPVPYSEGYNEISQNSQKNIGELELAAKNGDTIAMQQLGNCYYNGNGVLVNYKEAVKWWKLAAEKGNKNVMNTLGDCYHYGIGIPSDKARAYAWYNLAVSNGKWEDGTSCKHDSCRNRSRARTKQKSVRIDQ